MTSSIRAAAALCAVLALAACQPAANTAGNTAAGAPPAANTAVAAATPPAPVAAPLAPVASLPQVCQDYVAAVEACAARAAADTSDGLGAARAERLRLQIQSQRQTWALAADDHYRENVGRGALDFFNSSQRARETC